MGYQEFATPGIWSNELSYAKTSLSWKIGTCEQDCIICIKMDIISIEEYKKCREDSNSNNIIYVDWK